MKVGDDADSIIDEGMILAGSKQVEDWLTDILFGQKVSEVYSLMQNKGIEKKGLVPLQESIIRLVGSFCFHTFKIFYLQLYRDNICIWPNQSCSSRF